MRQRIPFILLGLAILAAMLPLWYQPAPYYVLDDGPGHLVRIFEFDRAIRQGVPYPRWAPDLAFGYGYPVFNFYAPLTAFVAEDLHLLGLTLPEAIKAILAITVLVGAFGAFLLSSDIFEDQRERRLIGVLCAIAYIAFPYYLVDLYARGAIAEAMGAALLPWLIWAWRRLIKDRTIGSPLLAAFFSAALVLCHNLTAFMAAPIVGIYVLAQWVRLSPSDRRYALALGGVAVALGAMLAAVYWLPMLVELPLVGLSRASQEVWSFFEPNFFSPANVIQLSSAYRYEPAPYPLALTPILIGLLGAISVFSSGRALRARGTVIYFSAIAFVSTILMTDQTKWIWQAAAVLRPIQFPWRLSIFVGLGVACAVGALAASVLSSRVMQSLRLRSTRVADLAGLVFVILIAGLLTWAGVSKLAPKRMDNPQGDLRLGQVVRVDTNVKTLGVATMNEYTPLTVHSFPHRLNLAAPDDREPAVHLTSSSTLGTVLDITSSIPISLTWHAFYFPDWQATVDGSPVAAYPSTPIGLLTVDVPAGTHRVAVGLTDTPPRKIGFALSGLGALAWLALAALVARRREQTAWALAGSMALTCAVVFPVVTAAWLSPPPVLQPTAVNVSPALNLIGIRIDGAALNSDTWRVSDSSASLHLEIVWQVKRTPGEGPLAWRLVDSKGAVSAARELYPRYAAGQPLQWVPNEIVPDYYDLSLDPAMPPGRYVIQVADAGTLTYANVTTVDLEGGASAATTEPLIGNRASARIGDTIQFVGHTLPAPLRPGQVFPVILFWKTDTSVPVDYTSFVQLLDSQGKMIAQDDGLTGDGFETSTLWAPGKVVRDWRNLYVPEGMKPGLYHLIAGLYLLQDVKRLPVVTESDGRSADDVIDLGEVKIPMEAQGARISHPLEVSLGPAVRLFGYDLNATGDKQRSITGATDETPSHLSMSEDQTLSLTLYWQASSLLGTDYTVFVQVVDKDGRLVAQQDGFPGENRYPTRIWQAGEKIKDIHNLSLKGLPAGQYELIAGMYDPTSGARLPAIQASGSVFPDNAVPIGLIDLRGR